MRHDIGIKMKGIVERLDSIAKEKERYHFALEGRSEEPERIETTPLIDVSEVCGRKLDKDALISKLCDDIPGEISPSGPLVVSIVESFDKTQIAKMVIEAIDILRQHLFWRDLQRQLHNCVNGKKILLVLDDVRTDDFQI
ncbi:hypothetical protein P3X46_006438 [Hevea brasiliensis]|uniref:NB-ARC domain-containing protein n=1 Tax=Hevea brasiliensis TaxID=3981 RepID=A0ABQ9MSR6_HEVBR|nr:hypothetical protein P3X46_006438 [Hevea brasiliensis]